MEDDCKRCDWRDSRQHIQAELTRLGKSSDAIQEQLRTMERAFEDRERRLLEIIKGMDDRFEAMYRAAETERNKQAVEIGRLGVKAGFFGGMAGAIPVLVMVLYELLRDHVTK